MEKAYYLNKSGGARWKGNDNGVEEVVYSGQKSWSHGGRADCNQSRTVRIQTWSYHVIFAYHVQGSYY